MIKETGRVVAIDKNYLWLETINRGTCGTCAAEKGCGQSLLARWMSHNNYLKVDLEGRDPTQYEVNDVVSIGVPENLVVLSSLLMYCLPLILFMVGAGLGQSLFNTDLAAVMGAVVGVGIGAVSVRIISWSQRHNRKMRPVIMDLMDSKALA